MRFLFWRAKCEIHKRLVWMANEQNLRAPSASEARERGQKGGVASGAEIIEKKTIQNILNDYLESEVKSKSNLKKIAKEYGITGDQTIKELVTVACVLNTLRKGDIEKLSALQGLLGEDSASEEIEDISEAEEDIFGNG